MAQAVRWLRSQVRGVPAHTLIWTLVVCSATVSLLLGLQRGDKGGTAGERLPDGPAEELPVAEEEREEKEEKGDDGEEEVVEEKNTSDGSKDEKEEDGKDTR